jgi:hypothetical protein
LRLSLRGTISAIKAAATLRRLQLPYSKIEGRRRGFIILQIDALSHEDLQRAMEDGHLPFLQRLLASSHTVSQWRSGAPSDTAAIQCSLMYGKKSNVPGFYWYDRRKQRPVICSWPLDMAAVETENADGSAGLFRHGSVYMGMAAGGAQRAVFTTSALGRTTFPPKLTGIDVFLLLVLNPWRLLRAAFLTVAEIFIEVYEQAIARARRRYVAPEGIFPLTRAFTHVLFRELTTLGIRLDIFRGVPAIYANYIGYDEVAHHLGPRSTAAYRSLRALDRQVRDVYKAVGSIGLRPYDVYVMSDHGMTESLPFQHLYGQTLGQFIASHGVNPPTASELDSRGYKDMATLHQLEELSAEIGPKTSSATSFFVDRMMRLAMRIGTGPLQAGLAEDSGSPVLAIYSSALANVYFTHVPSRPDLGAVEDLAPGLLQALVHHPGIGIILVKSGAKTAALYNGDAVILEDATHEQLTFLAQYDRPEVVRKHLIDLASMPCAGDLMVFGAYDGSRVVNFEDHGGAHGGLGGAQMFPFMIAPSGVEESFERMTDATHLHPFFSRRYQLAGRTSGDVGDIPSVLDRTTSQPAVAAG